MSDSSHTILLVDDEPGLLRLLSLRLESAGYNVKAVEDGAKALASLDAYRPDLVVTDLRMDNVDGMSLLHELGRQRPGLPVIILTAHGTIPEAVEATQHGAQAFLTKPVNKDELLQQIQRALTVSGAPAPGADWRDAIVTRNTRMIELLDAAQRVAGTDSSVLITGQSGTGKELLARAIHNASPRSQAPFVAINCTALPDDLMESELFGHEKGAFTGANRRHEGLLRSAHEGSIFLDEIGDMPLPLQAKLLRVLEERQVRPVGSTASEAVDVRVISATHRDLDRAMRDGDFREDLYYRLNVVQLSIPALNERRDDIPLLVNRFLDDLAKRPGGTRKVYAPEAMELLVAADWPGNVRQLRNVVEQNVALSPTAVIAPEQVRHALGAEASTLPSFDRAREEFTRGYLTQLLKLAEGNVSQAARHAKRNRTDFYKLLSRHDIDPADYKKSSR